MAGMMGMDQYANIGAGATETTMGLAKEIPKWILAAQQKKQIAELKKNFVRPDFEIPDSQKLALESAKTQAGMTRMPGQTGIEGQLDQITANQIGLAERLSNGGPTAINAASMALGQRMQEESKLGVAAANNWQENQSQLRHQLDRMSEWEFKKWAWDKQLPYENKAAAIAALTEARWRNINNAAEGSADSVSRGAALAAGQGGGNKATAPQANNGSLTGSTFGNGSLYSSPQPNMNAMDGGQMSGMPVTTNFSDTYPFATEFHANRKPTFDAFSYGNIQ